MLRYRLHAYNAHSETIDQEGADFPNRDAARQSAIDGIRSFLSAELLDGIIDLDGHLDFADDAGVVVASLPFMSAVEILIPTTS